jgi:hypothetical protein
MSFLIQNPVTVDEVLPFEWPDLGGPIKKARREFEAEVQEALQRAASKYLHTTGLHIKEVQVGAIRHESFPPCRMTDDSIESAREGFHCNVSVKDELSGN